MFKNRDEAVRTGVLELHNELQLVSPVDTGELRESWQPPKQVNPFTWEIRNPAPHAYIIDGGRRQVPTKLGNMKWIGSKKLPHGYQPTVLKYNDLINNLLRKIK